MVVSYKRGSPVLSSVVSGGYSKKSSYGSEKSNLGAFTAELPTVCKKGTGVRGNRFLCSFFMEEVFRFLGH